MNTRSIEQSIGMNFFEIALSNDKELFNQYIKAASKDSANTSVSRMIENILGSEVKGSTSQHTINIENERYREFLMANEAYFEILLKRCDFEDGMLNEAILFVRDSMSKNESVTFNWFNGFYGRHLNDKVALNGILRILSFIDIPQSKYRDVLIPIIQASLKDSSPEVQESALMLIETVRTEACLEAIRQTEFNSDWLRDYANDVKGQLEEELTNAVYSQN